MVGTGIPILVVIMAVAWRLVKPRVVANRRHLDLSVHRSPAFAVGLTKGDTALADKVNAVLEQYVGDGSWKQALENTVDTSGYDIPDAPTPGTA